MDSACRGMKIQSPQWISTIQYWRPPQSVTAPRPPAAGGSAPIRRPATEVETVTADTASTSTNSSVDYWLAIALGCQLSFLTEHFATASGKVASSLLSTDSQ